MSRSPERRCESARAVRVRSASRMARCGARLGRRAFLKLSAAAALRALGGTACGRPDPGPNPAGASASVTPARESGGRDSGLVTLFLCGDVMTGRGLDQVLPHPSDPRIYEPQARSALQYVALAERANGPIGKPVAFSYPWGDALAELERIGPDARIINLETSVTRSDEPADKGIHYRMDPRNVPVLTAAKIDCCVLANNHVLDWERPGLVETLATLQEAGLATAGAGRDRAEADAPAIVELASGRRVLVFAFGSHSSGIPGHWAASNEAPGVSILEGTTVAAIAARVRDVRQPGDVVVASMHWGENWGYGIPRAQRTWAHVLLEEAGVDVIHGHSSHHPKGIEVHAGKPILYGCGDFLNDYEGIGGFEEYRGDLALMYFVTLDPSAGRLVRLEMQPLQVQRFRLHRASQDDARWLGDTLDREGAALGTRVDLEADGRLVLGWG